MSVRHLYSWSLRNPCPGTGCSDKKEDQFRCDGCLLTTLEEKKANTLPGVVFQNAMSEYNDIQIGMSKRIEEVSCLEFIGMVVIHNELNKWREEQAEASARAMKNKAGKR